MLTIGGSIELTGNLHGVSLLASIAGRACQGLTEFCDDRSPRVESRRSCPTTF